MKVPRPYLAGLVGLLLLLAGGRAPVRADEGGWDYRVRDGDTLSEIAVRFDVSVDDLCRWNEDLDPDLIRTGQRLRILDGRRRVEHVVRAGENLTRIARRWEVDLEDLLRWNHGLVADRVRVGRRLRVYTPIPESRSLSIGTPQRGRLEAGRQMPRRHAAFWVRQPERAWGTEETVRWIVEAYEALRAGDPEAPQVAVHDLSRRGGGPLDGHHSHRSGRDADIAYFQRGARDRCTFRRLGPESLDADRQWAIFAHWIERDRVEAIFVDHALQRPLHEAARQAGVPARELSRIFQWPRPADDRYGLIRHHPRHANHFHVRFVCHESDPDCR